MRADKSMKIYPRLDQEFKKKSSLDFQKVWGNVYKLRPTGSIVQLYFWLLCLIIGIVMGSLAFLLDIAVEFLQELRWESTQAVVNYNVTLGLLVILCFSILYVLISALLTVYVAPAALGSGVAEAMGIMNGVAYPDYISLKTLVVKYFGLILAVAGGICGGKEGPLVHIGSIVGYAASSLPFKCFEYFKCDVEKRKLLAVGIAAGVSSAFGAPIGGSLFAYEISKPNTFWSFSLTWKVFFASSISTFVLSIEKQLWEGDVENIKVVNSGNVKLAASDDTPYLDSLPGALVIGILGGMVGALFIRVNNRINYYRKKILKQKWQKVVEACLVVFLTVTVFYVAASLRGCTEEVESDFLVSKDITIRHFNCPHGYYSRLATLFFDSQSDIIRTFLSEGNQFEYVNIVIFFSGWVIFTFITSGTAVPCGIFLPCILIGCALGHLIFPLHQMIFGDSDYTMNEETMCILGATAVLSGSTRLTYSLAVIMLETTSNVDLFLPIIFTLFASYGVGALLINKSIYGGALRAKNIPLLQKRIPKPNRHLTAFNIMVSPAIPLHFITTVEEVYTQLSTTSYNGFPVLNTRGQPIGIIERDTLVAMIDKEAWYEKGVNANIQNADDSRSSSLNNSEDGNGSFKFSEKKEFLINHDQHDDDDENDDIHYPRQKALLQWQDLNQDFMSHPFDFNIITQKSEENRQKQLDMRPYMIERPFLVSTKDTISKVHLLFRQVHLRQLLVTDDNTGRLEGIITRQDLFQYMSL